MQIRLNSDVTTTNEDGTTNTILKGWIISDVVSVSACPKDTGLRSVQIESAQPHSVDVNPQTTTYQYLILPVEAFTIEESPGWQAYARREEDRVQERKAA